MPNSLLLEAHMRELIAAENMCLCIQGVKDSSKGSGFLLRSRSVTDV